MNKSHIEHYQQAALFKWRDKQLKVYPQLKWMYATVNSSKLTPRQGAWLKSEGKRKGVWDIFLPHPSGNYCGLWIEMKSGKNGLTEEQKEFREDLKEYYCFAVCYSAKEAEESIIKYFGLINQQSENRQ